MVIEIKQLQKQLDNLYKLLQEETTEHGLEIVEKIVNTEIELEGYCNQ
jgi:hypothetical protein